MTVSGTLLLLALSAPKWGAAEATDLLRKYPTDALSRDASAGAAVEMIVDPKGRVVRCKLRDFVGDKGLAQSVCGQVRKMKVTPASVDGRATYGRVSTLVTYAIDFTPQAELVRKYKQGPDLTIYVSSLPRKMANNSTVEITALIDSHHTVTRCEGDSATLPTISEAACRELSGRVPELLRDDVDTNPFIATYKVEFAALRQVPESK